MNLFLTEDDVFDIIMFIAEDEEGDIYCDIKEEGVESLLKLNKQEGTIEKHVVTFRKPSFGYSLFPCRSSDQVGIICFGNQGNIDTVCGLWHSARSPETSWIWLP